MFERFNHLLKTSQLARILIIAALISCLILVFIAFLYGNFGLLLAKSTPFPVDLHSSRLADYSADPGDFIIPPMELQLVIDAIWDQNPNAQDLSVRLTEVNENFLSAVASITPTTKSEIIREDNPPGGTSTAPDLNAPTPETGVTSPAPSLTFTTTPSRTQPTTTNTPKATSSSPTQTAQIPLPSDTPTSQPASRTPAAPTNTTAPPTNTPLLPTNTPFPPTNTIAPCSQISLWGFSTHFDVARFMINNNSTSGITISQINLSWPEANGDLDRINLGHSTIWDGNAPPPSISISGGWTGSPRNISSHNSRLLSFRFDHTASGSGYALTVTFTNGCSISGLY
jgi:hypothetical protein